MKRFATSLALMLGLLAPLPAIAQSQSDALSEAASVDLLTGWRQSNGTHMAAVKVTLKPGWKTYWRAPGDSGIPPQLGLAGSNNLQSYRIHWPRPEVFDVLGSRVIGYKGELVLPIEFTPDANGRDIDIRVHLELGVCRDICLPVSVKLTGTLAASDTNKSALITDALANRATPASASTLKSIDCSLEPYAEGFHLTVKMKMSASGDGGEVVVFEFPNRDVWISEAVTSRTGSTLIAKADMENYGAGTLVVDRSKIRTTVIANNELVDIQGCATK